MIILSSMFASLAVWTLMEVVQSQYTDDRPAVVQTAEPPTTAEWEDAERELNLEADHLETLARLVRILNGDPVEILQLQGDLKKILKLANKAFKTIDGLATLAEIDEQLNLDFEKLLEGDLIGALGNDAVKKLRSIDLSKLGDLANLSEIGLGGLGGLGSLSEFGDLDVDGLIADFMKGQLDPSKLKGMLDKVPDLLDKLPSDFMQKLPKDFMKKIPKDLLGEVLQSGKINIGDLLGGGGSGGLFGETKPKSNEPPPFEVEKDQDDFGGLDELENSQK